MLVKKFMVLLKIENLDRVQISFYVVSAAGDREGPNRLPLHRPLSLASFFFRECAILNAETLLPMKFISCQF